jgi:3-dehydroquinate synthetase
MLQRDAPRVALDYRLTFGDHKFPYYVRRDGWTELLPHLDALEADCFVIVVDSAFPAELAEEACYRVSSVVPCTLLICPSGEPAKTLTTLEALAADALRAGVTRRSCVIALGGGLAGNVAGLLAALLFRGIRLVHVPTTLLAMSDSVLSLKQAVNSKLGKNHLGTFYTPEFVWTDLAYLDTLPIVEIHAALCELIKNVLTICPEHYDEVAALLRPFGTYTDDEFVRIIEVSLEAKGTVMRDDAHEKNDALVLEYGHTVGHALELLAHGTLPHGFAVGLGMLVAARISVMLGMLSRTDEAAHYELLRRNGAPTAIPATCSLEDLAAVIALDNKRGYLPAVAGMRDMVLLEHLGTPHRTNGSVLTPVSTDLLLAGISAVYEVPTSGAPCGAVSTWAKEDRTDGDRAA